ncbi:hypothetical protein [Burkholderia phage BCSR5]|nr:hypothetical protein [Burkholderia phage BCSR5]
MKSLLIATAACIVLSAAFLTGCTDSSKAKQTLEAAGYTDIQITGYDVFACSKDDTFHTGFTARNPRGQFVEGTVCSAWFKGATIRF